MTMEQQTTVSIMNTRPVTLTQLALFLLWGVSIAAWLFFTAVQWRLKKKQPTAEYQLASIREESLTQPATASRPTRPSGTIYNSLPTAIEFFRLISVFGLIMYFFYLSDYQKIFLKGERTYSRDFFIFIFMIFFAVAGMTCTERKDDPVLHRDQTEEWKGWMQTVFVLYHYFKAAEVYNLIRILIASYVWMTGFGNFLYFQRRKDFSIVRLLHMLFRLNFLVVIVCGVVDTEYVLYYICPMHTLWFLATYLFMFIGRARNDDPRFMYTKFAVMFVICALLWDVGSIGEIIFSPLYFILGYQGSMHEWMFRSGLDHYASLIGMFTAYHYDGLTRFLERFNSHQSCVRCWVRRGALLAVCGGVLAVWYHLVYVRDKFDYNRLHPYTSFIPVTIYILLRNMTSTLRTHHLAMLSWLGKITLETYISQLHIYLQSNAKDRIVYIPGYPLVNWVLATVVYLYISQILFHITVDLNRILLPNDTRQLTATITSVAMGVGLAYGAAALILPLANQDIAI